MAQGRCGRKDPASRVGPGDGRGVLSRDGYRFASKASMIRSIGSREATQVAQHFEHYQELYTWALIPRHWLYSGSGALGRKITRFQEAAMIFCASLGGCCRESSPAQRCSRGYGAVTIARHRRLALEQFVAPQLRGSTDSVDLRGTGGSLVKRFHPVCCVNRASCSSRSTGPQDGISLGDREADGVMTSFLRSTPRAA